MAAVPQQCTDVRNDKNYANALAGVQAACMQRQQGMYATPQPHPLRDPHMFCDVTVMQSCKVEMHTACRLMERWPAIRVLAHRSDTVFVCCLVVLLARAIRHCANRASLSAKVKTHSPTPQGMRFLPGVAAEHPGMKRQP